MKKLNKGMVITSTIAAAIAAMTLAGCGNKAEITRKETAVQAAANTAVAENAAKAAEVTAESKTGTKKEETRTATSKKDAKKKSDKKKSSQKTEKSADNGVAVTAKVTVQPAVIVPQQAQDNKQTQPKQTKSPETVIPEDVYPVWVEGDMYAGTYTEEKAGRGTMEITRYSDGTYAVRVDWSSSAYEKCSWTFSGEFNGRAVMHYDNCCKTTVAFDENGNYAYDSYGYMTPYNNYTNGSGYIEFKDEGVLEWHSDMGDILPETIFVSCKKSGNTKADEIGTAGSCYYENENTKADEVGTAGSCYYENENTKADEVGTAGSGYYASELSKAAEIGTAGSNYYANENA